MERRGMEQSNPSSSTSLLDAPGATNARARRTRAVLAAAAVAVSLGLLAGACGSNDTSAESPTTTADRANTGVIESDETPSPGGKLVYGLYS